MNHSQGEQAASARHLGYLLSRYPAISHTFFLQEIRGLRDLGFQIDVASINPPDRKVSQLTAVEAEESANTHYIKSIPRTAAAGRLLRFAFTAPNAVFRALRAALGLKGVSLHQRLYSLFYVAEALLIVMWIRERRIRHLHIHFGGAVATVGMIAAAAARISYSLTIHGPDEFFDEGHFHLRQKIESARFVIAISNYCRSQLMRIASPACWSRFDQVRLGIRPEQLPAVVRRAQDEMLELVTVGRLVPAKGPLLLLQAVERVRRAGCAVRLTFIGDGPERASLESFIATHNLGEAVTLTGALNHDQTLERVATSDLFVLASFAEGIPVALMEAMALGVPCISTYIAGIPELIADDDDGILVPAGSIDALTDAIQRLSEDSLLRQRFAERARAHVLREYHLETNLKQLAATLERRLAEEPKT